MMRFPLRYVAWFCVLLLAAGIEVLTAQTAFEQRLSTVFRLWNADKAAELALLLQRLGNGGPIEDIRLFLLAECMKKSGHDAEAFDLYARLMKQFPDSIGARRAGLPYILMAAKNGISAESLALLKQLALSLPTAYQRGRSLEGLAVALPPNHREKAPLALLALRAYREPSGSLAPAKDAGVLLKTIVENHQSWSFTPEEWIEVCQAAIAEGLGQAVLRLGTFLKPALGPHGSALQVLIQADALRVLGQRDRAVALLEGLLHTAGLDEGVRALAAQIRGQILAALNRHDAAEADFRLALAWGKPPVDVDLVRVRLVRSAFAAGHDRIAFEQLQNLCQTRPTLPLLPGLVYELGLKRYDDGYPQAAVPYLLLLPEYFPGHYRADDALGYAAIALGTTSPDGMKLVGRLKQKYPHSFFLYWLDEKSRQSNLPCGGAKKSSVPNWAAKRLPAWKILLKSDFAGWARDEIRQMQDEHPLDAGLFQLCMRVYEQAGDFNQVTACGERYLKNLLDAGKSGGDVPRWAWEGYYPRPYWTKVQAEAKKNGIDPYWVLAIMREESHFNPKTLSRSNAMGLMQILPSTGKWIAGKLGIKGRFDKDSLWDVSRNIAFGSWYLAYLRDLFGGDLFLAAAAYNGGQGNIQRKVEAGPHAKLSVLSRLDRVPLPETRDYYKKVMGSWWNYHRLYGKD